jgi:hypothetical protein
LRLHLKKISNQVEFGCIILEQLTINFQEDFVSNLAWLELPLWKFGVQADLVLKCVVADTDCQVILELIPKEKLH